MKAQVWGWDEGERRSMLTEVDLTERMAKLARVEVMCGVDHDSIWVPGRGQGCRYARGYVTHRDSGIIVLKHDCHLCNGYWLVSAVTPPELRRCSNCKGPVVPTGQANVWPDLLVAAEFIDV